MEALTRLRMRLAVWRFSRQWRRVLKDAMWCEGVYPGRLARVMGRSEVEVRGMLEGRLTWTLEDMALAGLAVGRRVRVIDAPRPWFE
jgi:hypothetical protein